MVMVAMPAPKEGGMCLDVKSPWAAAERTAWRGGQDSWGRIGRILGPPQGPPAPMLPRYPSEAAASARATDGGDGRLLKNISSMLLFGCRRWQRWCLLSLGRPWRLTERAIMRGGSPVPEVPSARRARRAQDACAALICLQTGKDGRESRAGLGPQLRGAGVSQGFLCGKGSTGGPPAAAQGCSKWVGRQEAEDWAWV